MIIEQNIQLTPAIVEPWFGFTYQTQSCFEDLRRLDSTVGVATLSLEDHFKFYGYERSRETFLYLSCTSCNEHY